MNERRSVPRVAPAEPLKAKVFASFPVRVLDISERGAQLEVERSLRPNVACELRFPSPEGEVVLRAMVRRCRAWGFVVSDADQRVLVYRAGVEFERPDGDLLQKLKLAAAMPVAPPSSMANTGTPLAAGPAGREGPNAGDELSPPEPTTAIPGPPEGTAPRGPVKIRIRSDYVRRILQPKEK